MSASSKAPQGQERRTGTRKLVRDLTKERGHVLALYWKVAGLDPFSKHEVLADEDIREEIEEFCQMMVDYLAAGHFNLYRRIAEGDERRNGVRQLAGELYPMIAQTTDVAMDFNDKYRSEGDWARTENMKNDLSQLGQALATRIELEDRLLQVL